MSVQQHLPFGAQPGTEATASQRNGAAAQQGSAPSQTQAVEPGAVPAPVWLQRMSLIVLVIFCLYLGLLITVLPWWTRMWDGNELLLNHPSLHDFLMQGAVRGAISGLGLLDLWIGISELIHYRDYRK